MPNDRREELVPITREGSADEDVLEDATNRIEELLRSQGYRDASAPHSRDERNGELYITFNVRKGPQYRVGRIDLSGNLSIPLTDLQQHLRIRPGQPYSDAALESERMLIEDFYHREGFVSAQASIRNESEPAVAGAVDVPVAIRIAITENVRTVVERVRIEGNSCGLRGGAAERPDACKPDVPFPPMRSLSIAMRCSCGSRISVFNRRLLRPIQASAPTVAAPT